MKIKILSFMILILFLAELVSAEVIINQVLYDPIVSESTGEAVELYNNGETSVDISEWILETGASEQDAILPQNTILQTKQYYLLADNGWNLSKQETWREADLEETINLYNTDSGIALLDNNFNLIDAVGWGNVTNPNLYETAPANQVNSGKVLKRINETNNNLADFIEAEADFSENIISNEIVLEVEIVSPLNFEIDILSDDSELDGIQIMPNPGEDRRIFVRANTTDEDLTLSASFQNQTKQMEFINEGYETFFDLSFSMAPGNYNVVINSLGFEKLKQFEYFGLTALEIDTNRVAFDNVVPGNEVYVYGDKDMNTANNVTIQNIGNVLLDVSVSGTDLISGENRIHVSGVMFSFDNNFDYVLSDVLDYNGVFIDLGLSPALTNELGFKLNVPINATGGKYLGKVSVVGVGG